MESQNKLLVDLYYFILCKLCQICMAFTKHGSYFLILASLLITCSLIQFLKHLAMQKQLETIIQGEL